ncbi:MAG: serine hydrolase domain-containing protein [Pseudomonadota bacterium]
MALEVVAPESVGLNSSQLARVTRHLEARYLQPRKICGCITLVARRGQVCFLDVQGQRDLERGESMTEDTILRIYSMTKPITSLALMTLFERGLVTLDDRVDRYIPAWRDLRVWQAGSYPAFATKACDAPMTVRHLLTHTSGLTYDFMRADNIDYAYRKAQIGRARPGYTLSDMIDELSQMPLLFSPGERWNYSLATDVVGHLVEIISGRSLPEYLQETVFGPLDMTDTAFQITPDKVSRFASCYERGVDKQLRLQDDGQNSAFRERSFFSGGGGLISTVGDYYRFCAMLLNGGTLDGQRIIGSRTLRTMSANHLPNNADLTALATGSFSESAYEGVGFGLGFASKLDPVANGHPASRGSFLWGGLASTLFWVDPTEELVVVFATQLMPSSTFDFRGQLENMIYAALN